MNGRAFPAAVPASWRMPWPALLRTIWGPSSSRATTTAPLARLWAFVVDLKPLLPEILATLGLVALVWISIGVLLSRERQHAADAAANTTAVLAGAFEESTRRVVTEIDQILLSARSSYRAEGDSFDIQKWAQPVLRSNELRVQVALMDRSGNEVASTLARSGAKSLNIANRSDFQAQLDPTYDDLSISGPTAGPDNGEQTIQFTRKLLDSTGGFDGVAVLSLSRAQLADFYETARIGGGFISLLTSNGVLLVSGPAQPGAMAGNVGGDADVRWFPKNNNGSAWWGDSSTNSARIISYRRVSGYPLIVEVGFTNGRIFQQYWYSVQHIVLNGVLATTLVLLLGGFWVAQRRRTLTSSRALSLTLSNMSQGIAMIDAQGNLPVINEHALKLLNVRSQDAASGSGNQIAVERLRDLTNAVGNDAHEAAATGSAGYAVVEAVQDDGRVIQIGSAILPDGGAIHTLTDVTDRHRAEERIRHLAHNDALTGLPNRVLLDEKLVGLLDSASANDRQVLTILVDLDGFKGVNDTLGHLLGDQLLAHVAGQIRTLIDHRDFVARLGGDEFVVLQSSATDISDGVDLANRLVELISTPVILSGHEIRISASVGISVFPQDGTNKDTLFRKADIALYRAKAEGRARCVVFQPGMEEALQRRMLLEDDLRRAVETGVLQVHYQPQFDCRRMRLVGFEALVRWLDPQRGWVPPSVFIGVAEECGLIGRIGERVLEQACREAVQWPESCRIAVNVSPIQLRDPAFASHVQAILRRTGLSPRRLELEITESVMSDDSETTITTMAGLRALGVSFALDDFGTGYSSLSNLLRFQFDKVKIDRSFVLAQNKDPEARAIVEAIVVMSRHLGLMITAEGVETSEQLALLKQQGCPQVQGHLLGMPIPGWQVPGLLKERSAASDAPVLQQA